MIRDRPASRKRPAIVGMPDLIPVPWVVIPPGTSVAILDRHGRPLTVSRRISCPTMVYPELAPHRDGCPRPHD